MSLCTGIGVPHAHRLHLHPHLHLHLHLVRTFVYSRIKWVRDPFLYLAVEREKNLKQVLSLKNQIVSSPSNSLPLSSLSPLKSYLNLSTSASKIFQKYPSFFSEFQPSPSLPLHKEELAIHNSPSHRNDTVRRLAKLLMLTKSGRLPLYIIDKFKFDLGLPSHFITFLLSDYPEYFQICENQDPLNGKDTLFLELISWRKELAVSEMENKASFPGDVVRKIMPLRFFMKLPNGFDLEKKVKNWVETWQDLPYISPYENAFHMGPNSDQAEKWTVAVLHELLWLLVSKKTERENVFCLGEYLGFGKRLKKALVHFPGTFYVSNKIRTQTVLLREAYRKDFLLEKHPLMGMRFRYIHLMNKAERFQKSDGILAFRRRRRIVPYVNKQEVVKEDNNCRKENMDINGSFNPKFADVCDDEKLKTQMIDT